jgi:hypothetical protein
MDPRIILDKLNKLFPPQLKILTSTFDESLNKLMKITTVNNYEDRKVADAEV